MNTFDLRQLGDSDLRITPVIFGAWAIGGWMWGGNEEADSIGAIQASIDAGINMIDTAAIYGMGYSEELVAKAVAGRRDKVLIATKCGMRWNSDEGADPWQQQMNDGTPVTVRKNAKPDSIRYEVEESLRRLKTDVIDLYQIHWPDSTTPPEESIKAMDDLKRAGKVRAIGVSNYDAQWMARVLKVARFASNQPPYSIIQRKIEQEILPFCRQNNIGVICYSPLERGLLAGAVGPERTFAPGDHRASHKFFTVENRKRVMASLEKVRPIAQKHGKSLAQVVINATVQVPGITAAIVGARNAEQAKHNAEALSFKLSGDECAAIRAAFDETSKVMMG